MSHYAFRRGFSPAIGVVALILASHSGLWAGTGFLATADIRFRGSSTLHGFEGSLPSQEFVVQLSEMAGTADMGVSAEVIVRVAELTTHHEKRDRNMQKMLDQDHFTIIKASVTDERVPEEGSSEVTFFLRIRDRTEPVKARISQWRAKDGNFSFHLTFLISLKAFGLKTPSVLGVIRVGDEVSVTCDVHPISLDEGSATVQKAR